MDASKLTLSWSGNATVKVSGTAYNSGEAPIPVTGDSVTYTITTGSKTVTCPITTVQGSDTVESMFLNIDESKGTIKKMNADKNHDTSCYGELSFNGSDYYMSVKGRGNSTWTNRPKKPYNFTIFKDSNYTDKKNVEFLDGVKSKKYSLLANYSDGTLLRNKIGYDLACKLGVGLKSRFVDLWMNGEYLGNYLLTPKTDYDAPKNGYLLELDNKKEDETSQFSLTGIKSSTNSQNAFTIKDIGDKAVANGASIDTIKPWMQDMLDAVLDTNSEEYLNYIDLDSWAKIYLLNELYKNFDIVSGSIFMRREGLTDADKLQAGPLWDLDNSMGRIQYCEYSGISSDMQFSADGWYINSIKGKDSFLQFLGNHKSFMERVCELYKMYKSDFDGILDNVEAQTKLITDSAVMNFKRWDINQPLPFNYNVTYISKPTTYGTGDYQVSYIQTKTWADYLTNLKTYLTVRLKFLSDNLTLSTPEDGSITGATDVTVGDTLSLSANTTANNYQWQSSADKGETWTNISGANKKDYSTTVLNTMDGLLIRCVANNSVIFTNINYPTNKIEVSSAKTVLSPITVTVLAKNTENDTVYRASKPINIITTMAPVNFSQSIPTPKTIEFVSSKHAYNMPSYPTESIWTLFSKAFVMRLTQHLLYNLCRFM